MPTIAAETSTKKKRGRKPQAVRRDPEKRSVDYSVSYDAVANADPGRVYKWIDPLSKFFGPGYYESIGYTLEIYEGKHSPHARRFPHQTVGKPVVGFMSQVLMSVDNERNEDIIQNGVGGNRGQKLSDRFEKSLIKGKRQADGFRGLAGDLAQSGYAETGMSEGSVEVKKYRVE